MSNSGKTDLQRDILLTWYNNPNATNKEVANACDCSASYVSEVKNRFDDYDEFEVMMDREDRQMEQMFGGDIFTGTASNNQRGSVGQLNSDQADIGQQLDEIPNTPTGIVMKAIVLAVLLFALYQTVTILMGV